MSDPDSIANLHAWWRADDAGTNDGDSVATWPDRSGNGRDLGQSTAGSRPVFKTNIRNGQPVVRFDGVDDFLTQGTAADWKFLSDGSSYSMLIVYSLDNDEPDVQEGLIDTGGVGTANIGFSLRYDDRSSLTKEHRLEAYVSRGTLGTYAIEAVTRDHGVLSNRWHITELTFNASLSLFGARTDGRLGDTAVDDPVTGGFSASNPGAALHIGSRSGGTAPVDGDIAEVIVYSSNLRDAQIRTLETYLSTRYAIDIYRYDSRVTVFADGSSHYAYGSWCIAANGDFLAVARKATGPSSTDGVIVTKRSRDRGQTWGAEVDLGLDPDYDYRNISVTTLSSGRIVMSYAKYDGTTYGPLPQSAAFLLSGNNGNTWGAEILPSAAFDDATTGGCPVLELANGDLLCPVWGRNAADAGAYRSVKVLTSTDSGDTWSVLSTLADGPTDTRDYTESGLVDLGSGNLVAIVRVVTTNEPFFRATSSDSGATWGAKTLVERYVEAQPHPLELPYGTILDSSRVMDETYEYGRYTSSTDDGVRWQKGEHVESPLNDEDRYAYGNAQRTGSTIYFFYFSESTINSVSNGYFLRPYGITFPPPYLHIPFKTRMGELRLDDQGIPTPDSLELIARRDSDNWQAIERWARTWMDLNFSPAKCLLYLPFKMASRDTSLSDMGSRLFANHKTMERWAHSVLTGACGCGCAGSASPSKCLLYIPFKTCLMEPSEGEPISSNELRILRDKDFDNYKAIEFWANRYANGECGCTC